MLEGSRCAVELAAVEFDDESLLAVDGVDVPGTRETVATLQRTYAERRLRPLARRRFRIMRPARVDMRLRKPCFFARLRTFG